MFDAMHRSKQAKYFSAFVLAILVLFSSTATAQHPFDVKPFEWPHWRGPEQNGYSRELGIVDKWSPDGENVLWSSKDLGTRSTPIIFNGKLYTLARYKPASMEEGEKVVCANPSTGEILWETKFNVFLSDVPDTRVAWSSVVADPSTGLIYAQGVCGLFLCLDGDTGKILWSRSLSEEFGVLTTYGGRTNFPIVYEDLVITSGVVIGWGRSAPNLNQDDMAKPAHRFMAFDKKTGEAVWFSSTRLLPEDTTYSAPVFAVIGGQPAIVFGAGDGIVYAMQPRTGNIIWRYEFSRRGLNSTPLVANDTVFIGNSEENIDSNTMGAIVALDALTGKQKWKVVEVPAGRSSFVLADGKLFAADDKGTLYTFDPETGKQLARPEKLGTMMRASLLYADSKLYVAEANGRWWIFKITDDGLKRVHRERLRGEVNASPIVSAGRLYVTTSDEMFCIGKPNQKPRLEERPELIQESAISEDPKPAHVQIVPVESLIKPGETIDFRVHLFNSRGQFLKEVKDAKFQIHGKATIDQNGHLIASKDANHEAIFVTATVGDLKPGVARIRSVPELPWAFDFNDGNIPVNWIGIRYRHQTRDVDGKKVLVKITTIPKGTRSQGWLGPIELNNYTIEAEVLGKKMDNLMPDIGLIAQRYRLELMGASQQLKLYSWYSHDQKYKEIDFPWNPDVWYRMKLQAATEIRNGQQVVVYRGKVWPKEEDEPENWSIEDVNLFPDTMGSPGLSGNAKTSEIFFDNIKVYPNNSASP